MVPVNETNYRFQQMQLAQLWHVCGSHGKRNCHAVLVLVTGKEIVMVEPQTVSGKRLEECKLKVTLYATIIAPNGSLSKNLFISTIFHLF